MIARLGETTKLESRDMTTDGILVNIYLKAAAVNVSLSALTDFLAKEVTIKSTLYRNKKLTGICVDNLLILGIYSSLNYNMPGFYRGNVITYKDVAVKEEMLVQAFIHYGGCINIKGDDEFSTEVLVGRGVFSSNIDSSVSQVEFSQNRAIGYEIGTPTIRSQVVTPNQTNDNYSLGDNVTKLAFLQLDKDNISSPALVSVQISSTQYSANLNFFDTLNRHWNYLTSPVINWRYGNTQPVTAGNEAFPYLPKFPQTVMLHVGTKDSKTYLDNCQIAANFNSANINAGMNYFVATSLEMSQELIVKAQERQQKHAEEKVAGTPVTV